MTKTEPIKDEWMYPLLLFGRDHCHFKGLMSDFAFLFYFSTNASEQTE